MKFFQDSIPDNHCFGCGPHNLLGLRIKSHWSGPDESTCTFRPSAHHTAGPLTHCNGGIIATIIDCHCVCTAIAKAYASEGRAIGEGDPICFVTGRLEVDYRRPVPMENKITLTAMIVETKATKTVLACSLQSENHLCAEGRVVAVRVPGIRAAATGEPR